MRNARINSLISKRYIKYAISKNSCFFILVGFAVFHQSTCIAQQVPSAATTEFKLFFEKVYLHLDRSYYASGDDVWFKAYLVNGQNNQPINTSNNLYVELIDPNASIVARRVIRMDSAVGVGDFHLGDSIAGGTYRIRAYTNWMRNFGSLFVFEKEIQVSNIHGSSRINTSSKKTSTLEKAIPSDAFYKVQFFPEGGNLVEGIPAIVSFKAEDASGKGIEAKGRIVSSKGSAIATFETSHSGMGSFKFTPEAGLNYKALIQYKNNKQVEEAFPVALANGYTISTTIKEDSVLVNINTNAATIKSNASPIVNLAARHAGKSYFKQQLNLIDAKGKVSIPTKDFPEGIAYITLYDVDMRPHAERLVYIEKNNKLNVQVVSDKNSYGPKQQATVNIIVTDEQKKPVKAALSLAAIDASMDPSVSTNIVSHLMLESNLKGKIEQPLNYFNTNNANRFDQLDLLLRTQGWRSFLWRQVADTTIRISYLPEPGITISGNVTRALSKKPLADMNVTLFAPDAKGDKIYLTKTNAAGKYYLDGLPLHGLQTIKLNVGDGIGKTVGAITVDSLFTNPLAVAPKPNIKIDTTDVMRSFLKEASKRFSIFRNDQWYNVLPNVTVTTKRGVTVLRDGSTAVNFGYPEYDFNINQKDYQYQNLRDFLIQKVPGALYDEDLEGVQFLSNGKRVRPILIVNKQQDVFGRLDYYSLSMQQISSVKVRHLVGSGTYIFNQLEEMDVDVSIGAGIRDFYLVTLDVKPGNYDQQLSKINVDISGYYESRMFYSPNYSKDDTTKEDQRATIFWQPLIKTDEYGKATVKFYNADPKTSIRIDVQGLTASGIPIVGEAKYEVK